MRGAQPHHPGTDRLLADAIGTLVQLVDTGEVERIAGVDVDHFVMLVARRTGADRRMLTTTVRTCRRLPRRDTPTDGVAGTIPAAV